MVTLEHFGPAWGLPDVSPFCEKVETYLRMAGVEFRTQRADVRKAPKQKLPCVVLEDGRRICDSRDIIAHFEAQGPHPVDAELTAAQQALSTAYRALVEEELYFYGLYLRWQQDDGWAKYTPYMVDYLKAFGVPGFLTPLVLPAVRKSVVRALWGQGTGRHGREEIEQRRCEGFTALARQLGDGPFFLGERPHVIDASVFACLDQTLNAPFPGETQRFVAAQSNLVAYCGRMRSRYYADAQGDQTSARPAAGVSGSARP